MVFLRSILIVILAMVLLVGCGGNTSAKETAAPAAAAESAGVAEPVATPETGNAIAQQPDDRDEGTAAAPEQTSGPDRQDASGSFTGVQGTEFIVPEGFIRLDENPNIGYQYTFWHPEHEIRIVIYEIAPGYIPEGAYETDYNIASRNPDVTYFNHGEKWFVQSGYNNDGEEIFYSKESMTEKGLKTFWITYPTAKREFGDKVTAEFEANFSF
ncbi:MAG: hypothetical protein K6F56_00675 [Oscillospiraceae bacterium]|nr:hypothetical protein [Oscillospiraceae bacterium]